ncbi:MAG TPA: hypothetical protein VMX94_02680 [Armatimonadota bacterium]|nr:hypothetical protein [Armatimonadota bacterium]
MARTDPVPHVQKSLRVPERLAKRLKRAVAKLRLKDPKASENSFIMEAITNELDELELR